MSDNVIPLSAPDTTRTRARILMVDDVPANLVALEAVLEPLGQELVRAESGEQALKHLLDDDFAVIVMDVQMPGLNGLETAHLIRSRQRTRHIPIIFVTALSREAAYVMRGYAEGAVDYLLKPVEPEILRCKVSVFVELYLRGERLKAQALEIAHQRRRQEELQRTAELEQQLVGIVGHDLRTPISAIRLTAQQQLADGSLPASQQVAFGRVSRGAERITRIVDLLLDFTRDRLGGGIPIVRKSSDLGAAVCGVIDDVRTTQGDREIVCELPDGPVIGEWDVGRLAQVVSNLADNAVKYSPPGTPIRVTVTAEAERAVIAIHNLGEPIAAEVLPTLFEPFRRGHPGDGNAGTSLGLGLYIAAAIVRAHGGKISVQSNPVQGTRFEVSLPSGGQARSELAVPSAAEVA